MDNTLPTTNQDGPVEQPEFADQDVEQSYLNGHISRALADVFDIIASFNDGGSGELVTK